MEREDSDGVFPQTLDDPKAAEANGPGVGRVRTRPVKPAGALGHKAVNAESPLDQSPAGLGWLERWAAVEKRMWKRSEERADHRIRLEAKREELTKHRVAIKRMRNDDLIARLFAWLCLLLGASLSVLSLRAFWMGLHSVGREGLALPVVSGASGSLLLALLLKLTRKQAGQAVASWIHAIISRIFRDHES